MPQLIVRPLEFPFRTEKWKKVAQLGVVCNLVDEIEPAAYIRYALRLRKVSNSSDILAKRLNSLFRNSKTGEIHSLFCEMKLVRIENDAGPSDKGKEFVDAPPMIFQLRVVEDSAVNATFISLKLCQESVEPAIVPIAR